MKMHRVSKERHFRFESILYLSQDRAFINAVRYLGTVKASVSLKQFINTSLCVHGFNFASNDRTELSLVSLFLKNEIMRGPNYTEISSLITIPPCAETIIRPKAGL